MPIYTDGVLIQECGGVKADTVNMELVQADATTVYDEVCLVPGSVTVYRTTASGDTQYLNYNSPGSWTFTVPPYATQVTLCMIGGGGGGAVDGITPSGSYGGNVISQTVNTTPGGTVSLTIGAGGAGRGGSAGPGATGGTTAFGSVQATGGAGIGFIDDGGTRTTCAGTFYNGVPQSPVCGHGGQAGFGRGGNGTQDGFQSPDPGRTPPEPNSGAGAGGHHDDFEYQWLYADDGADGQMRISWG